MNPSQAIEIWGRLREGLIVSDEEQASLKEWLSHQEHRKNFHSNLLLEGELSELLRESEDSSRPIMISQAPEKASSHSSKTHRPYRLPWKVVSSFVALLILTFSLSYMADFFMPSEHETIARVISVEGFPKLSRKKMIWPLNQSFRLRPGDQITTKPGQELEIQLNDGSHIWLGESSKLLLPSDFELAQDLQLLSGRLYLDVAERSQSLKVSTQNLKVHVLGTRFSLRNDTETQTESVHLLEGSVRVTTTHGMSQLLKPGQELVSTAKQPMAINEKPLSLEVKGKVIYVSNSRLTLFDEHGRQHSLNFLPLNEASPHPLPFRNLPQIGQHVHLEVAQGPNYILNWKSASSIRRIHP